MSNNDICAALDRLHEYAVAHPEHDTDKLVAAARAALAEPVNDLLEMGILVTNCHISGPVPEPFTNWNDYFIDVQKSGTLSGLKIEAICNRHPAALAEQPVLPTNEELDQLEEMLWDRYKTLGFQGEEFMFDHSFGFALADFASAAHARPRPPVAPGQSSNLT
jgi:hypothetical protein